MTGSITFNHRPLNWFTQRFIAGLDQTAEDNQNLNNYVKPEWAPLFTATSAKGSLNQDRRDITYTSADYSGTAKFDITRQRHVRRQQLRDTTAVCSGVDV